MTRLNIFSIILLIALLNGFSSSAQDEKKSIKLSLNYFRINDQAPELRATAKSKAGKKFEPVAGVEVEFFIGEQSSENSLGKAKTNNKGIALIEMPSSFVAKLDSASPFKFSASVAESKMYNEQSTEIEITKARIDLTFIDVQDKKEVGAKLLAFTEGKWTEVPETEMKIFVRRNLSDLSLTENALTTDSGGDVSAELNFKTPIPGDAHGNIIVGAKVEDNDSYGTIIALRAAKWGAPHIQDKSFFKRSLFASRDKTPTWLLLFPNIIIVVVWGLIFYMLYLIFKIRKVGLEN